MEHSDGHEEADYDDQLIIDIKTGKEIIDDEELEMYTKNPDRARKETMILCRHCYVNQLNTSLKTIPKDSEKRQEVESRIYSTIRSDISNRVAELYDYIMQKYGPDEAYIAWNDQIMYERAMLVEEMSESGMADSEINKYEAFEVASAKEDFEQSKYHACRCEEHKHAKSIE